jgi:hypothetical protein
MSYELFKFLTLLNNTSQTMVALPQNIKAAGSAIKSLNQ